MSKPQKKAFSSQRNVEYNSVQIHKRDYESNTKSKKESNIELIDPKLIKLTQYNPISNKDYEKKISKDNEKYKKYKDELSKSSNTSAGIDFYNIYRISERLIRANNLEYVNWRIAIRKSDEINAYSSDANYIKIYTSLYDSLYDNEDALAFVIAHEMSHLLERFTELAVKDEGKVESGNVAIIDFEGFKDGEPFDGGKGENYSLEIGSNTFIPGFEDQVIGMKVDEERDIQVKFPDEYFSKELAGKDATFRVKLHEIKRKELPELDDEFAKDVSEFDTIEELKNSIKEKLEEENTNKAKYETEDKAIQAVCDATELDIPSGMIETEIDNMMKDIETRLSYQGLNMKSYLQMIGKTEEDMRKEYEEQAKKQVKSRVVLEAIVEAEKLEASEEEIEEKVKEMATNYGREADELMKNEQLINYIKDSMKAEKAVKFVVDNAKIK